VTEQLLDRATLSDVELPKKEYTVERARFPLVLKLFLLTAILIVIVVGLAVGITIQRANEVANETVSASITGAANLFGELEAQRLARVRLPTELLGSDPNFVALVEVAFAGGETAEPVPTTTAAPAPAPAPAPEAVPPAAPAVDLASIVDQIEQRRESFGSDLVMLLDDEGRLIARTDVPVTATPPMTDLYSSTSLVQSIVDDAGVSSTSGVLLLEGKLYHAAVAPVGTGARNVRIGYLVNAVSIDDKFANRIAESTRAGVVFTPKGETTSIRSSNAPSVMPKQVSLGQTQTETVDQSEYILTSKPLLAGRDPVGTAIFLRSKDRELAPFREIEKSLLIGGGIALLLAFLLSWLIAKRVTRPIEQLAGIAQAVTAGDYSVGPDVTRNDEVGILGRSFGKMINSLRDKAELEELYAAMAEKSDEAASVARPIEAAKLDEGTVLVTDLRGLPATVGEGDAASVIATVERAMRLQEAEVARQDGEVREVNGHRLISVFRGERGIIHAIRAARAINEELASQLGPAMMSLGVGIATGEFVSGSVTLKADSGLAIVGNAPLLALLFAWHAPNGYAYVSYETAQAAGGEVLTTATREEVRLKWLPNALPVAALPLVSVTTGLMRSLGANTSTQATMRMSATQAGATAPASPQADLVLGHLSRTAIKSNRSWAAAAWASSTKRRTRSSTRPSRSRRCPAT
jgi:HAMP domain-containing protein